MFHLTQLSFSFSVLYFSIMALYSSTRSIFCIPSFRFHAACMQFPRFRPCLWIGTLAPSPRWDHVPLNRSFMFAFHRPCYSCWPPISSLLPIIYSLTFHLIFEFPKFQSINTLHVCPQFTPVDSRSAPSFRYFLGATFHL